MIIFQFGDIKSIQLVPYTKFNILTIWEKSSDFKCPYSVC